MIKIQITLLNVTPGQLFNLKSLESKLTYLISLIHTIAPEFEVELKVPSSMTMANEAKD